MSSVLSTDLSVEPILNAVEGYQGNLIDLSQGISVDAATFAATRESLAQQLKQSGLNSGDRVVLAVGNGPKFFTSYTAILMCGGSPLLSHVKTPPAELKRIGLRFGARHILCDGWNATEMSGESHSVSTIFPDSWAEVVFSQVDEEDPAFQGNYPSLPGVPLHQTSGTTGVPKVAVRPGACAVAEAEHYIQTAGITSEDVILAVPPMSHAYAYGMCVMVPFLSGADVVSMANFNVSMVFQAYQERGITIFPAVPAMLDMLALGTPELLKLSPKTIFCAGAPLPERTARIYRERSGVVIRPLYGTTETGGISIAVSERDSMITGCVGPSMNEVEAEVRLPKDGSDLGEGMGILYVKSTSMMAGYLSQEGIDTSKIEEGWFETGDISFKDTEGSLHLKGRQTEVINVAGMKVVPSDVEEVIAQIPEVREVKVYSGENRDGSQFVKTAVVLEGELDVVQVREHCKKHLIYYKHPQTVLFVDSLPKTASGKIILNDLP